MARYFGGFRDRLKKRSKHIPVTVNDVEWVKVATTFTWSPVRRDYQWLEPEDYLSSFLNSNPATEMPEDAQGDGSVGESSAMAFTGNAYDGSETLIGLPAQEEEEDKGIAYVPPYDFVTKDAASSGDSEEEGVLRPNIEVPAELPMLDEYKLEIVSALMRRGIRVTVEKVIMPGELADQLNDYHAGRVSIDSYELRARLQKYKRQVIESFERFSSVSSPLRTALLGNEPEIEDLDADEDFVADADTSDAYVDVTPVEEVHFSAAEPVLGTPAEEVSDFPAEDNPATEKPADAEDYESFILSSLNRLEASMNEVDLHVEGEQHDTQDPAGKIRNTRSIEIPPDTSDILAEGAANPDPRDLTHLDSLPSSYADDSWLVLPVDSRKAGSDLENPEDDAGNYADNYPEEESTEDRDNRSPEHEISEPAEMPLTEEYELNGQSEDFDDDLDTIESTRADSSELLKALNTINSRFPDTSNDDDLELNLDIFDEEEVEIETQQAPEQATRQEVEQDFVPAPEVEKPEPEVVTSHAEEAVTLEHNDSEIASQITNEANNGNSPENDLETVPEQGKEEASLSDLLLQLRNESDLHAESDLDEEKSAPPLENIQQADNDLKADSLDSIEIRSDEVNSAAITGDEKQNDASESVEEERARYIREQRKKLYSLIDEEETGNPSPEEDRTPAVKEATDNTNKGTAAKEVEETESAYNPEDLKAELARLRASVELNRRSSSRQKLESPVEETPPPPKPVAPEPILPGPISPAPISVPPAPEPVSEIPPEPVGEPEQVEEVEEPILKPDTPSQIDLHNLVEPEPGSLDLMDRVNGEQDPVSPVEEPQVSEQVDLVKPQSSPRSFGSIDLALTERMAATSPPAVEKQVEQPAGQPASDQPVREENEPATEKNTPVREESSQNEPAVSLGVSEPVFSEAAAGTTPADAEPPAAEQASKKTRPAELTPERIRLLRAELEKQNQLQAARKQVQQESSDAMDSGTESVKVHSESKDQHVMAEPQTTEQETAAKTASEEQDSAGSSEERNASERITSTSPDQTAQTGPRDEKVESMIEEGATAVVEAAIDTTDSPEEKEQKEDNGLVEADNEMDLDVTLAGVLESLAFATEDPIPLKKIARIYSEVLGVRQPTEKMMRDALQVLNDQYAANGRAYRIKEWAGGVRMASHPTYARFIRAIYQDHRPKKLSRTLMETLAIIAYSQPTTKPEIDFVRGVDSDYAVRKLLELGLIDIVGRSDSIGRPLLYGTSERFLEQFGLSEIEALPKLREVEDLLGDPAFKKERLQLLALEEMEGSSTSSDEAPETDKTDAAGDAGSEASGNGPTGGVPEKRTAPPDAVTGEAATGGASD